MLRRRSLRAWSGAGVSAAAGGGCDSGAAGSVDADGAPAVACVFAADFSRAVDALASPVGASAALAVASPLDAAGVVSGGRVLRFRFFGSGIVLSVQEQPARGCAIQIAHGNHDDVVRVNFSVGSLGVQRRRTNSSERSARAAREHVRTADELAATDPRTG